MRGAGSLAPQKGGSNPLSPIHRRRPVTPGNDPPRYRVRLPGLRDHPLSYLPMPGADGRTGADQPVNTRRVQGPHRGSTATEAGIVARSALQAYGPIPPFMCSFSGAPERRGRGGRNPATGEHGLYIAYTRGIRPTGKMDWNVPPARSVAVPRGRPNPRSLPKAAARAGCWAMSHP